MSFWDKIFSGPDMNPHRVGMGIKETEKSNKKLIVVQLNGGNDGLNTIVPFRNDIYYKLRPTIAVKQSKVVPLTDELGFHEACQPLYELYDQGLMTIINRVGYPNASRSHFKSMDFWAGAGNHPTGWLGRYLDEAQVADDVMMAIELSDMLGLPLRGRHRKGVAFDDMHELKRDMSNKLINQIRHITQEQDLTSNPNLRYIYDVMKNGQAMVDDAYHAYQHHGHYEKFGKSNFAAQLRLIAEIISSGLDTQVFYASLGSFDTHVRQVGAHKGLLATLSTELKHLVQALRACGELDNTLIMVFSEFGRRVSENGNKGTDHGAGNSLYLIGGALTCPGFYNDYDDLRLLVNGDLGFEIDFRQVYASILEDWLGTPSESILFSKYDKLDLFV